MPWWRCVALIVVALAAGPVAWAVWAEPDTLAALGNKFPRQAEVAELIKAVSKLGKPANTLLAYEAGPCGFSLARELIAAGWRCQVIAVSKDYLPPTIGQASGLQGLVYGTVLVGIVLFSIGTGPVKGFAVTLMIGIFTSVWTAIVVTRALVNFYYGGRQVKSLWIGNYI